MTKRIALALLLVALPALAFASGGEGTPSHLGVPDIVWKAINFLLFFGLIVFFGAKPIKEGLRGRREAIAARLAEAAKKRQEAANIETEIRAKIAALEAEVAAFAAKAQTDGEREKAELIARADAEAERIAAQAKQDIVAQGEAARRELAAYAGELAMDLAGKKIAGALDDKTKATYFDQALASLEKTK